MATGPLLRAIDDNSVSDLAAILETGVDVNRPVFCDSRGETVLPISSACAKGSVDIVKHLLHIGVDINIPGTDGKLPIHFTCDPEERDERKSRECVQALKLLILRGADVNVVDNMGRTPLFLACESDDVEAVKVLIDADCDVNLQTVCGDSPMKLSCRNAKYWSYWHGRRVNTSNFPPVQITKLLLQANADLSEATLLPTAVHMGDTSLVKELIDLGMDINMLDDNMCTPLGTACSNMHVQPSLVKLLLDHGADVNKGGGWKKQKPLIFAYVHNSVEKIKLLLSYGAQLTPVEMTDLVSITISKTILENPEVIGPTSKELLSWKLLMAHGFCPMVKDTELNYKLQQLNMCSSYDKISPWIRSLLFPLRSLKASCRIAIRRALAISIDEHIALLPLPRSLQTFLKLTEFSLNDQS